MMGGAFEELLDAHGARMVPLPMPSRLPPRAAAKYAQGSVTNWTASDGA